VARDLIEQLKADADLYAECPDADCGRSFPLRKALMFYLDVHYDSILGDISRVIEIARRSEARSANSIMTAAYWLIGRRIVEYEQGGKVRADGEISATLLRKSHQVHGPEKCAQFF